MHALQSLNSLCELEKLRSDRWTGEFFLLVLLYAGQTHGYPPLCVQKKEGEYTHPPYVVRGKEENFPQVL